MNKTVPAKEVFLLPGEYHFGEQHTRVRTLLGSCVAITLWHPQHLIGGMCHYMLPGRTPSAADNFDGKYADEALHLLQREIAKSGTSLSEYQVKLFGGGNMFPDFEQGKREAIGRKNADAGRKLVSQLGLHPVTEDLEGVGHRNVMLDLWSGDVWVKRNVKREQPGQCVACESRPRCFGK